MASIQLFKYKKKRILKRRYKLLFLTLLILLTVFSLRHLNTFLCQHNPISSKLLVVEGFLPDYTLQGVIEEFNTNAYDKIVITGKPLDKGYYLSGFKSSADILKKTMIEMGVDSNKIETVAIPQTVTRDRTYATGILITKWIQENNYETESINVYTLGCHARRSKLLFQKAVGSDIEVGIFSGSDKSYDPDKWWTSSKGFRTVLNEFLAYFYVNVFFSPDSEVALKEIKSGLYIDSILKHRYENNKSYGIKGESPLTTEQLEHYEGLKYWPINEKYKVKGIFVKDSIHIEFEMPTSTDRLPIYANFGKIHFRIDSTDYVLSVYQNTALKEKPGYEDYLFIPFRDFTCNFGSYGGGRYLNYRIPETDSVYLDFNLAYNPYCAYNDRYSCPIPPIENNLQVEIPAGEANFDDH